MNVFLHDICWAPGERALDVTEVDDLLHDAEAFAAAGFRNHHRCAPGTSVLDLARRAAAPLVPADRPVDLLVHACALASSATVGDAARTRAEGDVRHLADYPAARLAHELGLADAYVVGVGQQGCTGLLGALRVARALLTAEPELATALCVTADRFPDGARHEQAYNLVSDLAVAARLSREPGPWRLVAAHGLTNGGLAGAGDDETVGAFFSWAHRTVVELCARAGIAPAALDWIVPQNLNRGAWEVLAGLLGVPRERVAMPTLASLGHGIGGDELVNLQALERSERIAPGARVLLFSAGFGLTWQGVLLERAA